MSLRKMRRWATTALLAVVTAALAGPAPVMIKAAIAGPAKAVMIAALVPNRMESSPLVKAAVAVLATA